MPSLPNRIYFDVKNVSAEQIRRVRTRLEQHHQQMAMAVLIGYPIGTTVNESGNFEKPVNGRRVDSDEQSIRNT